MPAVYVFNACKISLDNMVLTLSITFYYFLKICQF
jgi:hypothetical protein